MIFEFDPAKSHGNRAKHGIDFEEAQGFWLGPHVIIPAKDVIGENRYAILGKLRGRIWMAIYNLREDTIRIISCHRADNKWEKIYESFQKKVSEKNHRR